MQYNSIFKIKKTFLRFFNLKEYLKKIANLHLINKKIYTYLILFLAFFTKFC